MPFDEPHWTHRVLRPDAEDSAVEAAAHAQGETVEVSEELPDDLAELAAQLTDDAAFLAQSYPAPSRTSELSARQFVPAVPAAVVSRRLYRYGAVAAMVVATVGLVLFGMSRHPQRDGGARDLTLREAATSDGSGSPLMARRDVPGATADQQSSTNLYDARGAAPLPPVSFQELTGPEQEAVIDLFEAKALQQASLSI